MSSAVYVALEKEIPGIDASSVCGKWLARAWEALNALGETTGSRPLADFVSADPADLASLLGEDDSAVEAIKIPDEQWFDPAEALTAVAAMLAVARGGSPAFRKVSVEDVIADLESAQRVLIAARDSGVRFHFAFDF